MLNVRILLFFSSIIYQRVILLFLIVYGFLVFFHPSFAYWYINSTKNYIAEEYFLKVTGADFYCGQFKTRRVLIIICVVYENAICMLESLTSLCIWVPLDFPRFYYITAQYSA